MSDVRANVSSVLREHELVLKRQQQEYDILKRYETELRDSSEFYE
jgi:hypothetical protein